MIEMTPMLLFLNALAGLRKGSEQGAQNRRVAVLAPLLLATCLLAALSSSALGEPAWTTYHRDAARSGVDPDAVNPVTPVLVWQSPDLGAPIWSQPLILGSRVYVATVGDRVYALDASTGKVIWKKSAGTPVPAEEVPCGDIDPTVGIVSTPVIDPSDDTLYVLADTWNAKRREAKHVLKGYGLAHGELVLSTPADPPGSNPLTLLQRPALNLDQGKVICGFGGTAGDCGEYRGAVGAAAETGGAPSFWQYSPAPPAYGGGAVWGVSGQAVDSEGNVYASTGNPDFPEGQQVKTYDYSDSVVKLAPSMSLLGNFEPESWLSDSNTDKDLSSAGPELLPGGLLFQSGKTGTGYLLDEATMSSGAPAVYSHKVCEGNGSFGGDAYSSGTIYVPCTDGVRALTYNQSARTFSVLWHTTSGATGPPIVSGGLIWSVDNRFLEGGAETLYGLEAATGKARYTETLPSPTIDHFTSPSAAGGRLFLATGTTIAAFQIAELAAEGPTVTKISPAAGPTAGGTKVTVTGSGFATGASATIFRFGEAKGSEVDCSLSTKCTVLAPRHAAGTVNVKAKVGKLNSPANPPGDQFTYH